MFQTLVFQYSKNLEGTKTLNSLDRTYGLFQYSKNLEGTKTACTRV